MEPPGWITAVAPASAAARSPSAKGKKASEATTEPLARLSGEPAAFAFYFFAYSTWRGSPVLYLEDVFVRPDHRRRGIGIALMRRLASLAVESRCERFVWQVLDWNEPAINFYKSIGARPLPEWITMRLEGDALQAFANP